jgi:SAM-dependent methyltransferase
MSSPLANWLNHVTEAFETGTLVSLTLHKPTPQAAPAKSIDVRPILVKREKVLSFTQHNKTNDVVKNHPLPTAQNLLKTLLGTQFTAARLHTQTADYHLSQTGKTWAISQHPPKFTTAPSLGHNQPKNHILTAASTKPLPAFFHALGLTDTHGAVLNSAQDKFRQINKYTEILDGLIKHIPPQKSLKILDMGAGKGYLTFALYHHLTHTLKIHVTVIGIEFRPELVNLCNSIAKQHNLNGLSFIQGSISTADCRGADVIIALHACNTATDDALAQAVRANAKLVVLAPCCHQQVRGALAKSPLAQNPTHPLHALLKYGTYTEKLAEMLTDTLRAHTLALHGYTTNVFEFIGTEHTPKNVMITALQNPKPLTPAAVAKTKATIDSLKEQFGLKNLVLGEKA